MQQPLYLNSQTRLYHISWAYSEEVGSAWQYPRVPDFSSFCYSFSPENKIADIYCRPTYDLYNTHTVHKIDNKLNWQQTYMYISALDLSNWWTMTFVFETKLNDVTMGVFLRKSSRGERFNANKYCRRVRGRWHSLAALDRVGSHHAASRRAASVNTSYT